MLVQASTSKSTLASHLDSESVPVSDQLRRLLYRLDKVELISLAVRWISMAEAHYLPPRLSKRPGNQEISNTLLLYHAIVDLNEERKARSLEELRLLWSGPMSDPKVPKARAMDRILLVDWPEGLSYGMIAEADLLYTTTRRTSRAWTAVKLEYLDDVDIHGRGYERLSGQQIQDRFSTELAHYFEHHVFLQEADRSGDAHGSTPPADDHKGWAEAFTYLRVVLAPVPSDICGTGLHILHIPRSPYILVSGNLGRGIENREIALSAFAQAAGATALNYPKPTPGSIQAKRLQMNEQGEYADGNRRTLGELRGKDPLALREVLVSEAGSLSDAPGRGGSLAGVAGGGKAREMRSAEGIEDGPLITPLKRRREEDIYSIGVRLPSPPASDEEERKLSGTKTGLAAVGQVKLRAPSMESQSMSSQGPRDDKAQVREDITVKMETRREARDLFGVDNDLTRIERIDYEMRLPFPVKAPYKTPTLPDGAEDAANAIKLRVEGTHVLAGLRKLVAAGMDRHTEYRAKGTDASNSGSGSGERQKLRGLPGWMTEVRGTKVVVALPGEGEDEEAD